MPGVRPLTRRCCGTSVIFVGINIPIEGVGGRFDGVDAHPGLESASILRNESNLYF